MRPPILLLTLLLTVLLTPLLASAAQAQARTVHECSAGGNTVHAARSCATGASSTLPPLADNLGPQGGDARTLLALEQARIAREREADNAARAQARQASAAATGRQKCARLRGKRADQNLARTPHGPRHQAARIEAQCQRALPAVECPA